MGLKHQTWHHKLCPDWCGQFLCWLNTCCFSFYSQTLEHLIYLCAELKDILTWLVSRHISVQQNQVSFQLEQNGVIDVYAPPRMLHRQFIYAHCHKRETEVLYYKVKVSFKFCCVWTVNLNKLQRESYFWRWILGDFVVKNVRFSMRSWDIPAFNLSPMLIHLAWRPLCTKWINESSRLN